MQYIYNYFKDWNLFEKLYLFVGIVVGILTSIIFNGTIIDSLYTITYLTTAILMSKGKVESFLLELLVFSFME